jgi:hypothetical protein
LISAAAERQAATTAGLLLAIELRSELLTEIRTGIAALEARLTKRMFFFWIGQAATTAGLVLAIVKLSG